MPTPCSACGGRCGADSAECVYAGSGPELTLPVVATVTVLRLQVARAVDMDAIYTSGQTW